MNNNINKTNENKTLNAVIYARYSCSGQREESIEGQVKVCKNFAEMNNYNIVEIYADKAMTGTNDNRPELQRLMSDSKKGKFQNVIVYSLDRFGRNIMQTSKNYNILQENNVDLLSATESISKNASGKLSMNILLSFAEYYSDELSQKVKRGLEQNAEKGIINGGYTPFGYKNVNKQLVIDEATAPYVKEIFKMYAEGKKTTEIIDYLNSRGLKTAKGKPFGKNSIHTILNNEKYIGVYKYNDITIKNAIPRIISDELFNDVAIVLKKNKKHAGHNKAREEYLLTTKIFCGHCKSMMTGYSAKSHTGRVYYYYSCNRANDKTCKKKLINKQMIEDLVINQCCHLLTDENIHKIAKEIVRLGKSYQQSAGLSTLKKNLCKNEREQANLITSLSECPFKDVRDSIYEKIESLKNAHTLLESDIAIEELRNITFGKEEVEFFLSTLKDGDINDIKYKRILVDIFVNSVYVYDDEKISMIFNVGDNNITVDNSVISDMDNTSLGLYSARFGAP